MYFETYIKVMSENLSPRNPAVGVGCIPVHNGRVLLVRNHRGLWSTPGGLLDFGESPVETAARETKEETGVTVRQLEFVAVTNDIIEASGKHYVTIWFRGEVDDPTLSVNDISEIAEARWCEIDSLPSPRHVYFENLLNGRTFPPLPASYSLAGVLKRGI